MCSASRLRPSGETRAERGGECERGLSAQTTVDTDRRVCKHTSESRTAAIARARQFWATGTPRFTNVSRMLTVWPTSVLLLLTLTFRAVPQAMQLRSARVWASRVRLQTALILLNLSPAAHLDAVDEIRMPRRACGQASLQRRARDLPVAWILIHARRVCVQLCAPGVAHAWSAGSTEGKDAWQRTG